MESGYLENKEKVNKKESIVTFESLKSDYFLQILFNNIKKKKSIDIVKYNKNIKKRINISINDYKEYSENYSSIEIEIKPVNNKFGKFFNIIYNGKYYHIFLIIVKKK